MAEKCEGERPGRGLTTRRGFLRCASTAVLGAGCGGPLLGALSRDVENGAPGGGVRWAMVVDTSKCLKEKGCTKCIDRCHGIHNVPKIESARQEIKWIWKEPYEKAFPQQFHEHMTSRFAGREFPVLCNHCDNPPCVRVCPTKATFKRDDGIVMMDMHRCIGCRYCMVACPYGSRSFNWRDPRPFIDKMNTDYPTRTRGVVEKCTFCAERLARNQKPACVEACDAGALIFGDVNDPGSSVRKVLAERYTTRRKPGLGTRPQVFYVV